MGNSAFDHRPGRRGRPRSAGSSVLTPPTGLPALPDPGAPAARQDPPPIAPTPRPVVEPCVCGHPKDAHDHYRPGTDCGVCGAVQCGEYRLDGGPVRRALRRIGLGG